MKSKQVLIFLLMELTFFWSSPISARNIGPCPKGPTCGTHIASDINGDHKVNYLDLDMLSVFWLYDFERYRCKLDTEGYSDLLKDAVESALRTRSGIAYFLTPSMGWNPPGPNFNPIRCLGESDAIPFLISVLQNGPDWLDSELPEGKGSLYRYLAQCYAALCLGSIGNSEAFKPLVETLTDANIVGYQVEHPFRQVEYSIRRHAAFALGCLGDCRAVEPLLSVLKSEKWVECIYALARLRVAKASPTIILVASEQDLFCIDIHQCLEWILRVEFTISGHSGTYYSNEFPEVGPAGYPEIYEKLWLNWLQVGDQYAKENFNRYYPEWDAALRNLPDAHSLHEVLLYQMLKGGVAAMPYVMEKMEQGDDRLVEAFALLIRTPAAKWCMAAECLRWWKENGQNWIIFGAPTLIGVLYVPTDYPTIQAAIDACVDGDVVIVAPGTYTGVGNRDIDFKGKVITVKSENGQDTCIIDCQGTEEDPHRGFYFHSDEGASSVVQGFTIINGFVGDGGAIFCGVSSPTICDCTIRSNTAQNNRDHDGNGGGIYCNSSKALIKDCKIIENSAIPVWLRVAVGGQGGGIYCTNSNLTITGCEISNNISSPHRGGAVCCWVSDVTIDNCTFNNNESNGIYINTGNLNITCCLIAKNRIDGIDSYSSNLKIADCMIADNQDSGVNCSSSNELIIKNCDISKNRTEGLNCLWSNSILIEQCLVSANMRRGIDCYAVDRLTVNNCTIAHNKIAGISCDHGSTNCSIRNSIIWENQIEFDKILFENPLCTISYSNIQGALESVEIIGDYSLNWGEGNINVDPNFVSPGYWVPNVTSRDGRDDFWVDGDYHLKSQAGRWDPNSQNWIQDDVTSPCIDAGDPNSPIGHEPFPNGGIINMGAYGGTDEASKSYFGEPVCETIVAGDINGDCRVDLADFGIIALHWLEDKKP